MDRREELENKLAEVEIEKTDWKAGVDPKELKALKRRKILRVKDS